MKVYKCFKHALGMVLHSKLRSWLTIIGIVIGVAAVIAIVSIAGGAQASLESQLNGLGGDILTVTPGFSRGGNSFGGRDFGGGGGQATTKAVTLTRTDVQVLRGTPNVYLVDTEIRGNVKVSYLSKNGTVSVTGVDQKVWSQITTSTIKEGRFLDSADQNVIVIGGRLASTYFSKPVGINQVISIEGNSYRVVGILNDQSSSIYMPIDMAFQIIPNKEQNIFDTLIIKMKDQDLLNETMTDIENRLMNSRHVTAATQDFSISSNAQQQATRAAALSSVTAFLVALAAVSLIVGAVGVANTMFTSVLEKTKEIGIMKAIGAANKDILLIFLFNSALIGFVGGAIGIIIGGILSGILPSLIGGGTVPFARGGFTAIVSLNSMLMAIAVSVGVGVIAGIIPAYQASKLKPVDALRYE
jgi:putative ABC transport system permease protein